MNSSPLDQALGGLEVVADALGRHEIHRLHLVRKLVDRRWLLAFRDGCEVVGVHHVRAARRGKERGIDVEQHAVEVVLHRRLGHGLHHHVGALAELLLREARLADGHQEVVRHHGNPLYDLACERPLNQFYSLSHFGSLLFQDIPPAVLVGANAPYLPSRLKLFHFSCNTTR